jgi:hypothetical protein
MEAVGMRSIAAVIVLVSVLLTCAKSMATDAVAAGKVSAPRLQGYSSPREAFDARRRAIAKRDWRTDFFSLTPASQDVEVVGLCEGFLLWIEPGGEYGPFDRTGEAGRKAAEAKLRAILKKYGVESGKVWGEYTKKYREKHGVDLDRLQAEMETYWFEKYLKKHPEIGSKKAWKAHSMPIDPEDTNEPGPTLPETDYELLSKTVLPMVTDKGAFYVEMTEFMTPKVKDDLAYDYRDLEGVTESGDTAKGWVAMTMYHIKGTNVKVADPPQRLQRCFRKLNGRWYNDTEKGEFQSWDSKGQ